MLDTSTDSTNTITNCYSSTNTNKQSKEKSFLRWINKFNNNNNNNTTNNTNRTTLTSRGSYPNLDCTKNLIESDVTSSNEYRGVEGLKQFWNNRISSIKDSNKIKSLRTSKSTELANSNNLNTINSTLTTSKSICCLINSTNSFDDSQNSNSFITIGSLKSSPEKNSTIGKEEHRKSDNFYKYKTAATTKPLSLDLNKSIVVKNPINNFKLNEIDTKVCNETNRKLNNLNSINFPLIASTAKGEKIHWARREDIFINRKQKPQEDIINDTVKKKFISEQIIDSKKNNVEKFNDKKLYTQSPKLILKNNNNNNNIIVDKKISADEKIQNADNKITTAMAKSSDIIQSQQTITKTPTKNMAIPILNKDKTTDKTDKITSLNILSSDRSSYNSSTNSLVNSNTDISNRKRNSSTLRKYSFKTHSKRNSYTPRKMANHQIGGSKVAALTMQFNQMVEKNSSILKEVKRKNGVLIIRSGHVYKVKEETDNNSKIKSTSLTKRNPSSESEEGSVKSLMMAKNKFLASKIKNSNGTVKATICKFEDPLILLENQNNHIENELHTKEIKPNGKPKVPQKSENVLKKTKDLKLRIIEKKLKPTSIDNHLEKIKEEKTTSADLKLISKEKSISAQAIEDSTITIPVKKSEDVFESEAVDSPTKQGRYTRIYEKFRLRSTFFSNKKLPEIRNQTLETSSISPDQQTKEIIPPVNFKLENLSKSVNDVSLDVQNKENLIDTTKTPPNESFLFRKNSKKYFNNVLKNHEEKSNETTTLIEAINTRVINKTQSMDEIRIPNLQIRNLSLDESKNYHKNNDEDEELYEPIASNKTHKINPENSSIFHEYNQRNDRISVNDDCIYQTIAETKLEQQLLNKKLRIVENDIHMNDGDCYENYESVEPCTQTEDGYEICDPRTVQPRILDIQRNTTDELPALPLPKRIIQHNKKLLIGNTPPPRPKKSPQFGRIKLSNNTFVMNINDNDDNENIYDTIKGSDVSSTSYEFFNNNNKKSSPTSLDTVSLISNCYETISPVRHGLPIIIRNSDSISITSSDHKTNSLYGMQMNSIVNTDGSSDNNSDDWIDISDGDDEGIKCTKQQFIVVRERTKCHRSPDWSKRVRDQRTHKHSQKYFDDDSDHYYEPVFPTSVAKNSKTPSNELLNEELVNKLIISSENNGKIYQKSINKKETNDHRHHRHDHHHHHSIYSDEYDSFDTDDYTDEEVKKNDSGVDISNAKLPDPPQASNQVYALVKKFKNFISNKKISTSPKSPSENSGKQYENTQFYITPNEYQNTNYLDKKLVKNKTPKLLKKPLSRDSDDPYENVEFHAPIIPKQQQHIETVNHNNSNDSSLNQSSINTTTNSHPIDQNTLVNRRKSKSEKSFKSKLRKSLTGISNNGSDVANALNSTRSTFYISDSVDLDSGIFEKTNSTMNPSIDQTIISKENIIKENETVTENISDKPIPVTRKSKRNLRSPDLNRRRTTIGIRPNKPPPPPPIDKMHKQRSSTSWYAECGVFKANGIGSNVNEDMKESRRERNNNPSWYAEAGLYQTSGASVASSSGSSGVSTGGEGCPGDDNNSHSMFLNEPLYQIYSAAKLESISRDMEDQESTDGYEEIGGHVKRTPRPSALQLVGPKQGPSRTLWSEIPEVINSEILSTLTPTEKRLQEAKFEVLTSEASYLKSLNLLRTHFMNNADFRDPSILSSTDRKTLFAHIIPVHECSDRLLSDLEICWQDNIMLLGLSKMIYKNAEKYFNVYVSFCEHQGKMDRTLRRLKEQKSDFSLKLDMLEHDAACCGLNLHSFLMLPMQRITRLPLLIDAVFSKLKPDDDEYENWKMTLSILNKIVLQCNEAANRYEQSYEIEKISRQIEFPTSLRSIAIAPVGVPASGAKPRALVKKGELIQFIWRGDDAKLTFGKKFSKCNVYAFLFTDLLILSKKKTDEQFVVFDYCQRSMLTIASGDVIPQLPTKDIQHAGKNLILMTLLENHEGKTVEMILSCPSVSDQQRWLEATAPRESETPGEKLYEQWDCPQVITKHEYLAKEPDLLSLEPGDVVNVTRKLPDGWYQGERIRDGVCGWFPGSFTEEVNSAHVRARNLKQRYRLLTFTASYIEMQKRK